MPPTALSHNAKVALAYAKAGFLIFPCEAKREPHKPTHRLPFGKATKKPLVAWSTDASCDETKIQQWWNQWPEALVAVPCKPNKIFLLDADRHTATEDGIAGFAALCEAQDEPMPPHPVTLTEYDGNHHIFRMPDEAIATCAIAPGIETRGFRDDNDGGYFIAPGSAMPDGRGWRRMEGTPSLVRHALPLPPQWLIDLCKPPKPKPRESFDTKNKSNPGKAEEAYAAKTLDRVASELAHKAPDTGRDNLLMSVAATMGRQIVNGWIGAATVEGRLFDACRANGLLNETKAAAIRDKILRGIEAGMQNPHEPLPERPKGNGKDHGNAQRDTLASGERSIVSVRANTLKPESISWAWKNRFAFGKLAMIAGDPGLGKSTVLIEIAALHSRGGDFPCGEGKAIQCEIAILTAEDGLRDTLVPRLIAAEAVMSKIHFLTGTKAEDATDETAMFDISRDVPALRKFLKTNPAVKILIIDPLTAYLGSGTKAKENADVRRVLTPLVKMAEDFGLLLLANNHLNKSAGKALYRVLDSIAFVALGRVIHLVIEDNDNRDVRKLICDKINIGSKAPGLTYFIQKTWIKGEEGEEIETSRIVWGTTTIDETADEALGAGDDTPTLAEAAEKLLREMLGKGRMTVQDIEAEARAAGMLGATKEIWNSKPFRTACDRLGILHEREGFGPGAKFYWRLP